MTNKLKSPESGVSRRDLLRAGGIALVAGVALAGCAKTGAGGNETPRSTSETQRSNETQHGNETQQSDTSENELIESKQATEKYTTNEVDFEDWERKTHEERKAVLRRWLESNNITEPMPAYDINRGLPSQAVKIADWFIKYRYQPLQEAYPESEYIELLARDVLTCNGENTSTGTTNRIYDAIRGERDIFTPEELPTDGTYEVYKVSDITRFRDDPDTTNELDPGCVIIFRKQWAGVEQYLMMQLIFEEDEDGGTTVRAVQSANIPEPKMGPKLDLYEVDKQTA